jgi:hypothetical protein
LFDKSIKKKTTIRFVFNQAIQMVVVVDLMMVEVENNYHLMLDPENTHRVHMKMTMMKEAIGEMNKHLNSDFRNSINNSSYLYSVL